MPNMTEEEITRKFKSFEEQLGAMKKDFEVKLEAANTDAKQWKETAEKNATALKQFEQKAKDAEEARLKLLAENRKAEIKSFVDQAKKEGRIIPAQEEALTKLMQSMTSEAVVHTFKAKDGAETSHTQYSLMKQFIASLAPHKAFVSILQPNGGQITRLNPTGADIEVHMTEIKRGGTVVSAVVDEYDTDLQANKFIADQAQLGRRVSYEDALIEISRQKKQAAIA